ncbi:MAG: amino acid adenylation domain-containing protein, partial [Prochloraceae cyanobacterium]
MTIVAIPGDELLIKISYNTVRFEEDTIERMLGHLQTIFSAIVENPQSTVGELPLLGEAERDRLLTEWNDTASEYPRDKCIHQLFEEQVEKRPDGVAVVFENRQLTYEQLNQRANQLAAYLQQLGVGPEVLVGICVERSLEMVVGLLGILKAGGAYVPLDPNYPQERLNYMLEDTGVEVLLTQQSLCDCLPEQQKQVVCLDTDWQAIAQSNQENLNLGVSSEHLAYVIYTSGSTGVPKGVSVIHRGVVRLVKETNYVSLNSQRVFLQLAPISFDASTFEIWGSLLNGAELVVMCPHTPTLEEIAGVIKKYKVTTLWLTAALFDLMVEQQLDKLKSVKQLLAGGDVLSPTYVQKAIEFLPECKLINGYGPTENTTFTCCYLVKQSTINATSVPIGRPIANTQIYILDKHLKPLPIGVKGQIYVSGDGLARGYLNRPELTREKFIANPFRKEQKIYQTGDLGRYLADGNIEFLGRIDNQVKVRGFRIELGEIEAALNTHPEIKQAVVITKEDISGNKRLVAYVVNRSLTNNQLRQFLKQKLPEYMIPSAVVRLENLPLTANGKIDRKALPAPNGEINREIEYVAPGTAREQTLTKIWQELLQQPKIGIHDNFFAIGGDSILSIQVVSRAKNAGIQITTKQIFLYQTIAELARVANTTVTVNARQGRVSGVAPLTPIQKWFLGQNPLEANHYNQSILLQIPNDIKPELLELAVEKLLSHHDALRLRFRLQGSHYQQIDDDLGYEVPFSVVDLSSTPLVEQSLALSKIATEFQASLNLSRGPLIQVVMFNLGREVDARLLIIIHHLVVDGVSWRILLSDLETIYQQLNAGQAIQLSAKTTAFIDWAEKLNNYANSQILEPELDYWLSQTRLPTTPLPLDCPGKQRDNTVASAASVSVKLSREATRALLGEVNVAYNTQINDLLLSGLVIALAEWTGNSNRLIDLEGHGREELFEDADLSRTVGWFTSLFPVLLQIPSFEGRAEIIKSIKEQLRAIPNRGIGYGILRYLCEDSKIAQQLERLPSPEISFNYLGQFDYLQWSTGWQLAREATGENRSGKQIRQHLLDINALVVEGQLQIDWTYSRNFHNRVTVEKLANSYIQAIESIIGHCNSEEAFGYTPSDFPQAKLNQLELDRLLATFKTKNIASIYPLSPTQQGMLFHSLYAPESGVYFQQISLSLNGKIDVDAFCVAWQKVVERHSVLRTFFVWENRQAPLQVILKQVNLPWTNLDWQGFSATEQQQQLSDLLLGQRKRGFQFECAPLMACTLIKLSDDSYKFIWSFHHILIDGWSVPIIFQEVLSFYAAQLLAQSCDLPRPRPYSDYLTWLNCQNQEAGIEFWRQTLQGLSAPTSLGVDRFQSRKGQQQSSNNYRELKLGLSAQISRQLKEIAQKHQLTLATIVQGAWALLLNRYSGEKDLVFGVTVSGRPGSLSGV